MEKQETKIYLNLAWRQSQDEKYLEALLSIISEESWSPIIKGSKNKADLQFSDCYFDDEGNLYLPNAYVYVESRWTDSDTGITHTDVEESHPDDYYLAFTKEELNDLIEKFNKDCD